MRTQADVDQVKALVAAGLNDCEVARTTGIPRGTVREWRHGLGAARERRLAECPDCHGFSTPGTPAAEAAYAYLLGIYLGDGHVVEHRRGVHKLRVFMDARYPGLIAEAQAALNVVRPENPAAIQTTASNCMIVYSYSKHWPCLLPQHGAGVKHARRIALEPWQEAITRRHPERLLRGLIHSDGCRFINRVRVRGKEYAYPRYCFSNTSDDIRAIFCEHLDLLGVSWRRMNAVNISVARRGDVERLDEFIGPKS